MKLSMRILGGLVLALLLAGSAAAQTATMTGEVKDVNGKPLPGVTVVIKSDDFGTVVEVKTDGKGKFIMSGMRTGIYTFALKNESGKVVFDGYKQRLTAAAEPIEINLKDAVAKEDAAAAEARKKQEEDVAKFETMKTHFEAGKVAMDQLRAVREEIQRTPAEQRGPLQEKATQLNQAAIESYLSAEKTAPEKDPNIHRILANLGQAYENANLFAEAADAYGRAIALKPTEAGYYLGWGTSLARAGKVTEGGAACDQLIPIDKAQGSTCWRNIGIVLYNTNKLKDAVGPLKRATELDPNYADTWYLLGASLVAAMEYKKEGDKYITVVQPGTAEAYQKYLDLAPSGRFAGEAKAGLDMLGTLGAGISTKTKAKSKK